MFLRPCYRPGRLYLFLTMVLAFSGFSVEQAAAQQEIDRDQRPNIIILLVDDLGYGELGCQGNAEIPTPHIDRIAGEGVRFTNGYVTASYCSSSRAGLITGRYQTRFGYEFNPIGADNEDPAAGLPTQQSTIANHLHDLGYATGLIGKWHLGGTARHHPLRRGFDEFFGFTHEGHYYLPPPYRGGWTMIRRRALPIPDVERMTVGQIVYTTHMGHDEPAYDANNPIVRGSQPVNEPEYLTDALTREAVDFISRHQSQPFFLMLTYNAVHSPLQATDEQMARFESIDDVHRRIFAAMLGSLDDSVGHILHELEKAEIDDDTLIFFLSDNGGPTRELTSSNAPLRGGKGSLYEGGVRVPYLARWPGRIAPQVSDRVVTSLDMFATIVDVTGSEPPSQGLDGESFLQMMDGDHFVDAETPRPVFWRMNQKLAYRSGDWKLVGQRDRQGSVDWELFNLREDIGEQTNVAASQPDMLRSLVEAWSSLEREMMDPVWRRGR